MTLRRSAAPAALTALMGVALAVSGVLAYQAHDAARSHREVAHKAVSDLASAAGWQLGERAQLRFFELLRESVAEPVYRARSTTGTDPTLDDIAGQADRWDSCRCVRLEVPATFFRLPVPEGGPAPAPEDLEIQGEPLEPAAAEWLTRSLTDEAAAARLAAGSLVHPGAGVLFREEGERIRSFVYYVEGMEFVYGFETDPEALVEAVLGRLLASTPLLPESLTGGLPSDSLFRVEVALPDDRVLFASDGPADRGSSVVGGDRLAPWLGGLEVRVRIPEDRAQALVIGGLPKSRLPLILLLLALTGGILLVAVFLLRQQARLARMRADFVAGVTHELRTPLAQIRMFAELLSLRKLASPDEEERALHVIDEESRRLDHLIDNVLGFARMGVADGAVALRTLPLDELLPEVVDRFRPLARERKATIALRVEPGLRALADGDAVHRILLNLLDNAVKYGPRGQTVRVRARRDGRWARIEVDDQGPGVPARDRLRIWEPYERLEAGIDRGVAGSGIGLAVVRSLVDGHGGRVSVEDAPGGGSRFVILIPAAESRRAASFAADAASGGASGDTGSSARVIPAGERASTASASLPAAARKA
jgi:signal transduction histidine kinase